MRKKGFILFAILFMLFGFRMDTYAEKCFKRVYADYAIDIAKVKLTADSSGNVTLQVGRELATDCEEGMQKAVEQAVRNLDYGVEENYSRIVVEVPKHIKINSIRAEFDTELLSDLQGKDIKEFFIKSEFMSIGLPIRKLDTTDSKKIILTAGFFDKAFLNDEQFYMAGDNPVYNIKLISIEAEGGSREIASVGESIKVELPCSIATAKDADRFTVFKVNIGRKPENLGGKYDFINKRLMFTTRLLGQFFYKANDITFDDIKITQWVKKFAESLASKGVLNGLPDGKYYPDRSITRAEIISAIVRIMDVEKSQNCISCRFRDGKKDAWYEEDVMTGLREELITGYGDKTIRPNNPITREEMAVILQRTINKYRGMCGIESAENIKDYNKIHDYAKEAVLLTVGLGVMDINQNKYFRPSATATREEAAKAFYILYDIVKTI